ncbi:MAG: hypothetical protein WCK35_07085 [Chloroflexota bacterium]
MNIEFDRLFSPWVIAGAVVVAFLLLGLTFFGIMWSAPPAPDVTGLLAIVTDIPVPTLTPVAAATPTFDPYGSTPTPTLSPGEFSIGSIVQITGTQGEGLRIRSAPGLAGGQLFLGFDTEAYTIMDGPRELDGYSWYYLSAINDQKRTGWAASNFLSPIINP